MYNVEISLYQQHVNVALNITQHNYTNNVVTPSLSLCHPLPIVVINLKQHNIKHICWYKSNYLISTGVKCWYKISAT